MEVKQPGVDLGQSVSVSQSQSGPAYDREEVKDNKFEQSGDGLIQVPLTFVYYIIFVNINNIL